MLAVAPAATPLMYSAPPPPPEAHAVFAHFIRAAGRVFGRLPGTHREAIVVVSLSYGHTDAAGWLGVSEFATRQRYSRAVRSLVQGLRPLGCELDPRHDKQVLDQLIELLVWGWMLREMGIRRDQCS